MSKKELGTLEEFLNTLNDDEIVAIGAKKGSSYLYFGRAGNRDLIEKVFDDYYDKVDERRKNYEKELKRYVLSSVKLTGDAEEDRKLIRTRAYHVKNTYNGLVDTESYIRSYVHPFERRVMETHIKEIDTCLAVIIEGTEFGDFWFKKEFDEKYGK